MQQISDKCISARENWHLPKIVDILPSKLTEYVIVSFDLSRDEQMKGKTLPRKMTGSLLIGILRFRDVFSSEPQAQQVNFKLDWGIDWDILEFKYPKNI